MQSLLRAILVLILVGSTVFAQNPSTPINQLNTKNERTGVWKIYYENGAIKATGTYTDGEKNGLWKSYYPSGNLKHEITYVNGIAKGPARFYFRDGTLWEEGYWEENHWKGEYNLYHVNGNKFYEWYYNDSGKRTGEQKYYHDNGKIQYAGKWKNGQIQDEVNVNDRAGKLVEKRQYSDGAFKKSIVIACDSENEQGNSDKKVPPFSGTGCYTLQSLDGLVIKEGYFKNGVLQDGKHFIYNRVDSLIEVKIVENGKYKKTLLIHPK
jgi:antitoxin component YwqK of YwqJK toxin-antitoxin module